MSARSAGVRLLARALPPFMPPLRLGEGFRLDSLTVSSTSPEAISKTSLASWLGSRGLLATNRVCHRSAAILKLRHCRSFGSLGEVGPFVHTHRFSADRG